MKKLILTFILVFVALSTTAQTIGDAFYIYRNDGEFNAFFRDEVDSITYSHYDADSICYDEIVTQLVYTQDSLYRIPIAAIDSVGFVQPETMYKEDVKPIIGELFNYLIKADSLILTFDSSIPSSLLPNAGDKLVATSLTDKLPLGFTGTVRLVEQTSDGFVVSCDSLALEETANRFYGVVEIVGLESDGNVRRYLRRKVDSEGTRPFRLVIPPIFNLKLDLSPFVKEKNMYDINGKAVATTSISPIMTGRITRVVDNSLNIDHYNIHAVTDVTTETQVEAVGEVSNKNNPFNKSNPKKDFTIEGTKPGPFGIPIYYAFGPTFEMDGEIALGTTVYANFTNTSDITYYPLTTAIGIVLPGLSLLTNQFNTVNGSTKMTYFYVDWHYLAGRISASIAVCGRLGIGLATKNKNLGWVGIEAQVGATAEAELKLDFEELSNAEKGTGLYDLLKDSKVEVKPYWGLEGKVSVLDDRFQFTFIGRDDYSFWGKKWEWDLLPKFSRTKAIMSNGFSAKASVDITNDCVIPYTVGFSLFDENGNQIGKPQWNAQKFWTQNGFTLPLETTFSDLSVGMKYKVFPTLRLLGFPVLASPSANLDMQFPVTLSDFKVTKSSYQKDGFIYNGKVYDYCFNVAVTATLDDDVDGIADWGYAYLDSNGNEALISLRQFGTKYTDTRYVYYRNEAHSTATLYGYVKYQGSEDVVYGEPHDYPLDYEEPEIPDNAVDLGLSVLWAKWNVGASTESAPGGLYGWADPMGTNTAYNVMNESGTAWTSSLYGGKNPPTDICGTSLDIATAKWGGDWRLPTEAEMAELIDKCSWEWTVNDGTPGMTVTGPNGNSVFLPAGGDRFGTEQRDYGAYGYYWTGTINTEETRNAYRLEFDDWGADYTSYARYIGHSVRPVMNKPQ